MQQIAMQEEVPEDFEVLDTNGSPLPNQPVRATRAQIDARTIEQFERVVPPELWDELVEDEPPASGSRTARVLGRMEAFVRRANEHSQRTRRGLERKREEEETTDQKLRRELSSVLAKIELREGKEVKAPMLRLTSKLIIRASCVTFGKGLVLVGVGRL
ncbi:MAG: hypothetical protein ABI356_14565 [Steroidobacteraceae bacterium]